MEGRTYPKIETLFERDTKTFKVDPERIRRPEFALVDSTAWMFTEKVDGTNIRIRVDSEGNVTYGGRTSSAQLPSNLVEVLNEQFAKDSETVAKIVYNIKSHGIETLTLFGEGYGPKIQKGGGNYREVPGFIGFDILVDNQTWLQPEAAFLSFNEYQIDHVPILDWSLSDAIRNVVTGFPSTLTDRIPECEGIVARPLMNLYDQRGNRVMWKLKTTDFHNPSERLNG